LSLIESYFSLMLLFQLTEETLRQRHENCSRYTEMQNTDCDRLVCRYTEEIVISS